MSGTLRFRFLASLSVCSRGSIRTFLLGILIGSLMISVWHLHISPNSTQLERMRNETVQFSKDFHIRLNENSFEDTAAKIRVNQHSTKDEYTTSKNQGKHKSTHGPARILCAVMTNPNISEKAIAVNNTWGRRCDILLFICEKSYPDLPMLLVNVSSGRKFLSVKHREAFDIIYRDYLHKADWFFKADDDTYIVMENLIEYLRDKNTTEPAYYGHHFLTGPRDGFITGGSGYVMSWEAMRRLGERKEGIYSNESSDIDDLLLSDAMKKLGVKLVNGFDSRGLHQFHFLKIYFHIAGNYEKWYRGYEGRPLVHGINNMTDRPITFHYVTPQEMYLMEYFLYRVRPVQTALSKASFNQNSAIIIVTLSYIISEVLVYLTHPSSSLLGKLS